MNQEANLFTSTGCEIQLVEVDSWSDDDDMGSIRVNSDANDKTAKGKLHSCGVGHFTPRGPF